MKSGGFDSAGRIASLASLASLASQTALNMTREMKSSPSTPEDIDGIFGKGAVRGQNSHLFEHGLRDEEALGQPFYLCISIEFTTFSLDSPSHPNRK